MGIGDVRNGIGAQVEKTGQVMCSQRSNKLLYILWILGYNENIALESLDNDSLKSPDLILGSENETFRSCVFLLSV